MVVTAPELGLSQRGREARFERKQDVAVARGGKHLAKRRWSRLAAQSTAQDRAPGSVGGVTSQQLGRRIAISPRGCGGVNLSAGFSARYSQRADGLRLVEPSRRNRRSSEQIDARLIGDVPTRAQQQPTFRQHGEREHEARKSAGRLRPAL